MASEKNVKKVSNQSKSIEPYDLKTTTSQEVFLKKAVEAIHMSGRLNLIDKRIFNFLILYAFKEKNDFETHTIGYEQLAKDMGFNSRNIKAFRASLKNLRTTEVNLDLFNEAGAPDGFHDMNLLSEVQYRNGVVSYTFPPFLRETLKNPIMYAKVSLTADLRFDSIFTSNLFDQIQRFVGVKTTGFKPIPVWRELLGAESTSYDMFKLFNYKVLKPAIKEIHEKTDYVITPDFFKEGRTVTKIKFDFQVVTKTAVERDIPELAKLLMTMGLTSKEALQLLSQYPEERIVGNFQVVKEKISAGKMDDVNKAPIWLKRALVEDWRPGKVTIHEDIEREKKELEEKKILEREEARRVKQEQERKKKRQSP